MKKTKKPYRVTVIQREPDKANQRLVFEVDGLLLSLTNLSEHTNSALYVGGNAPCLVLQKAVEEVCAGRGEDFINIVKGHLDSILDAMIAESKEGAKA